MGEAYIEEWPEQFITGDYAETRVTLIDGFDTLNSDTLNTVAPQEATGARLARVLKTLGIPAAKQSLSPGAVNVQAQTLTSENPLAHAQAVEQTERGWFYVARTGIWRFRDRNAVLVGSNPVKAFFGDNAGELNYVDLTPTEDRSRIFNLVTVSRPSGNDQLAWDSASRRRYRTRTFSLSSLCASDADSLALAQFVVAAYKEPGLRFDQITFKCGKGSPPALISAILTLDIGDRVQVTRRPGGGPTADPMVQTCLIAHVNHDARPGEWSTTFELALAP